MVDIGGHEHEVGEHFEREPDYDTLERRRVERARAGWIVAAIIVGVMFFGWLLGTAVDDHSQRDYYYVDP